MHVKVSVFYPGNEHDPERLWHDFEVPVTIDDILSDEPYEAILDTVFRHWNRVDGSEIERHLDERECRSMSVGDIVQFHDRRRRTFIVEPVGFRDIRDSRGLNSSVVVGRSSAEAQLH